MSQHSALCDRVTAGAVFVAAFIYLYAFHRLGWFLPDEGVLYYQYWRVYRGQLPYRDFFTGYAPLGYYLHACLFALVGPSINATRIWMAFVNAVSAAGLYVVGRRLAPPPLALIAPVLFLAAEPGDIAVMVFHNSPYPSWYAVTFSVWGVWAISRALKARTARRRWGWLFVVGLLGGLAVLVKQNAGIFFLWGVSGFLFARPLDLSAGSVAGESWGLRTIRALYLAVIPVTVAFLIRDHLSPGTLGLFVAPVAVLSIVGVRTEFDSRAWHALLFGAASVVTGATVVVLPWVLFFSVRVGLIPFLRAIFPPASQVVRNLYVPLPWPDVVTVAVLGPCLLWGGRRWLRGVPSGAAGGGGRTAGLLIGLFSMGIAVAHFPLLGRVLAGEYNPWEVYTVLSSGLDTLLVYGALLVLGLAVFVVWRSTGASPLRGDSGFHALVWIAACNLLVYYPRMDAAHLYGAIPLLYVVAAALLAASFSAAALVAGRTRRWHAALPVACLLAVILFATFKSAPRIYSRVMPVFEKGTLQIVETPQARLQLERADLYFPVFYPGQRLRVKGVADLVAYLQAMTNENEPIFAFPGLAMFYFLSGRENPTRHDYFLGDNVSLLAQQKLIHILEQRQVRTVVVNNDQAYYFVNASRNSTSLIGAYLRDRYYLERRFWRYDVLRRLE